MNTAKIKELEQQAIELNAEIERLKKADIEPERGFYYLPVYMASL